MYDEAAVNAFKSVRQVIEALGPPILFRKLYGVMNAIEMQVEDGEYHPEAVLRLGEALRETAVFYAIDTEVQRNLVQVFEVWVSS